MLRIHSFLKKYNIIPTKVIKNKNTYIIDNKYVLRENINKDIFKKLDERSFNYYPNLISDLDDEVMIEEYINEEDISDEVKIEEMIDLLSLLHSKTTVYKKVDTDLKKELYEKISNDILEIFKYYDEVMTNIESKEIFMPSEFTLAKNISLVFSSIDKAKNKLDNWYNVIKDVERFRYVVNHNNLDLNHFIKSDKNYFINWSKSKVDFPIYDLYSLFMNNELDYGLILDKYIENYPLLDYEKELLYVLLLIPPKLSELESEFDKTYEITKMIVKLEDFNVLK